MLAPTAPAAILTRLLGPEFLHHPSIVAEAALLYSVCFSVSCRVALWIEMLAQIPRPEIMDEDQLMKEVLDKFVNCHEQTYEEFLSTFTHLSKGKLYNFYSNRWHNFLSLYLWYLFRRLVNIHWTLQSTYFLLENLWLIGMDTYAFIYSRVMLQSKRHLIITDEQRNYLAIHFILFFKKCKCRTEVV